MPFSFFRSTAPSAAASWKPSNGCREWISPKKRHFFAAESKLIPKFAVQ
jgi:hypothetical protein